MDIDCLASPLQRINIYRIQFVGLVYGIYSLYKIYLCLLSLQFVKYAISDSHVDLSLTLSHLFGCWSASLCLLLNVSNLESLSLLLLRL